MSATQGRDQRRKAREVGEPPVTLTIREAADLLGVHMNTVRRRVKAGQLTAEKLRTDRGEEYRIYLDDLKLGPRAITEISNRTGNNGSSALPADEVVEEEAEEQLPESSTLYQDLKDALVEAASLRTERDIVQRQYTDARSELEDLRTRCADAEARALKLESERIELLAELEQLRIHYRRRRESKKRWKG